jgi:ATP-binding protein involved in chromosome partitioning
VAVDPRRAAIPRRLEPVSRVLAVTGGKGGIGKSLVSSALALVLARRGLRVGLLDLDLTGPCDHVVLGLDTGFPAEEFGVEPAAQHGLHFMSVAHFAGAAAAPLRGEDVTSAISELLAITHWPELDVLVVDMPPGLGDATLDVVRLIERLRFLVVATSSKVVLETVERMVRLLRRLDADVAGVLENMRRGEATAVHALAGRHGLPYLGALPHDEELESALGSPERLADGPVLRALEPVAATLVAADLP